MCVNILGPCNADEYETLNKHFGSFFGNIISNLRVSLGDFGFD